MQTQYSINARNRADYAARAAQITEEAIANPPAALRAVGPKFASFESREPAIAAWLLSKSPNFSFASSLLTQVITKGSLTDGQRAAAVKCIERDRERDAAYAARQAEPKPVAKVDELAAAFAKAIESGAQRPRLTIGCYVFKPAPATGKNPGAIYALRKADKSYLGMFKDGEFRRAYGVDPIVVEELVQVGTDPRAAAVMHGKEYGTCAVCSRQLTDPESIARSIGPICAAKFGW